MRRTLLLPVLLLAGCYEPRSAGPQAPGRAAEPVSDREKEFSDVPVPRGFRRASNSWSTERGSFRACRLFYHGPLDVFTTADFMQKQMELAGWKTLERSLENNQKLLLFSKGTDRARVTVTKLPSDRETQLTIAVDPQGAGE